MSKGCCCCWSNPCSVESEIASQSGSFSDHELINNTSMGSFGQRDLFTFGFFSLSYTLSLSLSLHSPSLARTHLVSLPLSLVETSKKRKLTNMRGKTFFSIISTLPPHHLLSSIIFLFSVSQYSDVCLMSPGSGLTSRIRTSSIFLTPSRAQGFSFKPEPCPCFSKLSPGFLPKPELLF